MKKIGINEQLANTFGYVIGVLALICILSYSWWHTGGLLSKHTDVRFFGYSAAFGIELFVFWISFKIGRQKKRKNERKNNAWDWKLFGWYVSLGLVVLVSMVANLSEGFDIRYGVIFNGDSFARVDKLEFGISVIATAIISIIVLFLSDVLGSEAKMAVTLEKAKESEAVVRESKVEVRANIDKVVVQPIEVPNSVTTKSKSIIKRRGSKDSQPVIQMFEEYVVQHPDATYRELASNVTGLGQISELKEKAERWGWHKNGNGWERVSK